MSALSIPGPVATHEDIVRLDERIGGVEARLASLEAQVRIGLAAVTRMQNWNFALLVLVLGALLARIVF